MCEYCGYGRMEEMGEYRKCSNCGKRYKKHGNLIKPRGDYRKHI